MMHIANRKKPLRRLAVLPLLCIGLAMGLTAGCSKDPEDAAPALTSEAGILAYVPADTPYVFAALAPAPQDVSDKVGADAVKVVQAYARMLKAVLNEQAKQEDGEKLDEETRQRIVSIVDEFAAMMTPDGFPEAGIDRNSRSAFYGVGLLPVLRIDLSDPAKFEAAFARMEAKAGKEMSVAEIAGHAYRYVGDDKGRVIVAVIDGQLVATLAPAALGEDLLKRVLGLTLPAQSIAESGELATLAKSYGYTPYGLGLLDVRRVAATFLDEQSGVNSALLGLMEHDTSALSDVCREEIRAVAAVVPRIVTGYTEMSADRFASNTVVELRGDLAAGLQKVTAPVPGLGQEHGGLLSFGMSINLPAFREFYAARLDALEADPFECELFAELQAGVATSRAALQQPMPPAVNDFHGFLAVIDDIKGMDIEKKQPPTEIDMRFLVATGNAPGLVAMGAMFSPQIAALDLKPDSKPVRFELPAGATPIDSAWVAMSENALALSVGQGGETGLAEMLAAGSEEPAPFMSMDVDAGRYYGFIGDVMIVAEQDSDEKETSPEVTQAMADAMQSLENMFERVAFDVQFTERGIEMPSTMVLAD